MTEITDASLDRYFREGTALEGVKALLRAGAVYAAPPSPAVSAARRTS